mmetsp:Transcript_100453/g.287572  ORF Transcript_100453/g.287572 Transcript_100453/m.287572 type:complete len:242 (-) Transcript_100453:1377-2102(-)
MNQGGGGGYGGNFDGGYGDGGGMGTHQGGYMDNGGYQNQGQGGFNGGYGGSGQQGGGFMDASVMPGANSQSFHWADGGGGGGGNGGGGGGSGLSTSGGSRSKEEEALEKRKRRLEKNRQSARYGMIYGGVDSTLACIHMPMAPKHGRHCDALGYCRRLVMLGSTTSSPHAPHPGAAHTLRRETLAARCRRQRHHLLPTPPKYPTIQPPHHCWHFCHHDTTAPADSGPSGLPGTAGGGKRST